MATHLTSSRRRLTAWLLASGLAGLPWASASPAAAQDPDSTEQRPHGATARDPHVLDVQEGVDFRVFAAGRVSSVAEILDAAVSDEVLLVGEEHDDRVGHAVELLLLEGAYGRLAGAGSEVERPLVLSLEMFEQDVQYVVDEYLNGLISEEHFVASARPWENYFVDYRPLVEFAKAHRVRVLASNAPRRYVSRVTAEGPEALLALSPLAQSFLPPLPYPGPSDRYRTEWLSLMTPDSGAAPAHAMSPNAIQAQALWDAAMGFAIADALGRHPDGLVMHLAGSFHVARRTGIPERIADYRPGARVVAVVMAEAEDVETWSESEHGGLADFVVLTRARR